MMLLEKGCKLSMTKKILTQEKAEELLAELIEIDKMYKLETDRTFKERGQNIKKAIKEVEL